MKKVVAGFLVILSIILIILVLGHRRIDDGGQISSTISAAEITATQIKNHAQISDCWTAIGGSVYDLTNYFVKNPNDSLASSICGQIKQEANLPNALTTNTLLTYKIGILTP